MIPKAWENIVQDNINTIGSFTIKDHHNIQRKKIVSINQLTMRELYLTLMSNIEKNLDLK